LEATAINAERSMAAGARDVAPIALAAAAMLRSTLMAVASNMMDRMPQEWNFVQ